MGTIGVGFLIGLITRYAIKKAAVIVGLFFAALACLAYLEYQRILNVDWNKVHAVCLFLVNGVDWVADVLTHVSSTMGASHAVTFTKYWDSASV
jgi:uncharacterized membrane protein (Fun14 family)